MSIAARRRDPATRRTGRRTDSALLSERRREEWARRTPEEKEAHLAAFIAAGQIHNRRSSKTLIEMTVRRLLEELGIPYRQNVQMGRFNVDFLCGDLIVECHGDFWHCNPASWPESRMNTSLRMTAGEKWKKDAERRRKLEAQGFRFQVFWESEIIGDLAAVRKSLRGLTGDEDERS